MNMATHHTDVLLGWFIVASFLLDTVKTTKNHTKETMNQNIYVSHSNRKHQKHIQKGTLSHNMHKYDPTKKMHYRVRLLNHAQY